VSAKPYRRGAKAYRGLGLGQAIPVTYGDEEEGPRPVRKKLIGHSAQRSGDLDRKREKAFRQRFGSMNLGLHLAEGVVSLDVDTAEELQARLREAGHTLPATPFSTARGATSPRRQLVYRIPEGMTWESNGLLPAGGEVIDAGHRYVRAWPSVHKSGAEYAWYFPRGDDAFGPGTSLEYPPDVSELAELPAEVVEWLTASRPSQRAGGAREKDVDSWIESLRPGKPSESLRRAVKAIPTEGADNNQLMDLFGPLVRAAWDAPGGRAAMEEGLERYAGGYGPDARREAVQAIGRAVGDHRAELEARAAAVTFPIGERRTSAKPKAKKSPSSKGKREKGKKAKRKKPKTPPEKSPTADPDYLAAKIETALDDVLRAEYAAHELATRLVFAAGKQPYKWTGKRWKECGDAHAREVVRQWHAELARQMIGSRPPKEVAKVLTIDRVNATLRLLFGLLARDAAAFDTHRDLLNTPSGVVDLRTSELQPHDPALYFTRMTKAPYVPGATHPDWDRALKALPKDSREWLAMKFGQALTGYMSDDDVMPICEGGGENAKSTIFTSILRAAGDFAVQVPDSLLQGEHKAIPVDKMTLRGVRIAIAEEASDDRRLNSKQIKDVLGTPQITARSLYQPFVTFDTTHGLFITTNHRLSVTETDWGTWRRLALVRFPYKYVTTERDPETGEITRQADPLQNERVGDRTLRPALEGGRGGRREAVLAWLVEHARKWYEAGRVTPPAPKIVAEETTTWRGEQDAIIRFAEERLEFGAQHFTSSNDLYQAFVAWLAQAGHPKWGIELFASRFSTHERIKAHNVAKAVRRIDGKQLRGWDLVGLRPMSNLIAKPLA